MKLLLIGRDYAALHGRHVMTEEGAEAPHYSERSSFPAFVGRPHRFAVVLDQNDPSSFRDLADPVEVIRVPEQVHGHDQTGALRDREREPVKTVVEGLA